MVKLSPVKDQSRYAPVQVTMLQNWYNLEKYLPLPDAVDIVERSSHLPQDRLINALKEGQLNVYTFQDKQYEGQQFVDRFELGRTYSQQQMLREGLTLERFFAESNPYESAGPFVSTDIKLKNLNGDFTSTVEFPASWEKHGVNDPTIVAQKYFFRPNKPMWKEQLQEKFGRDHEYSFVHLVRRVTNFFADEGKRLGYFKTEKDAEAFRDDLAYLQMNRMFAFNSPVYFNAGIYNEYGIPGSRGISFYRDPKTGKITKIEDGSNIHPQCHACFILGPDDDLESILHQIADEGAIFYSGSGVGQNISNLRGIGEPLSGGGKASGPLSFFEMYDRFAGTIKSGGKSRRAARMEIMDQNHPDILEFIRSKVREEHKALTLMRAGYNGGMDGEAYQTVAFQNTNLSVRLDDYFFEQLEKDGAIELRQVVDSKVVGNVQARRLLQEIAFGSWRVGDPNVQYESMIQKMHTCKNSGRIRATNPCSEYVFLDSTSCNLGSFNLLTFADDHGNFNVEKFQKAVRIATIALDIANDAASYPVEQIAKLSPEFRTIGVGYANLGALLMRNGISYDSDEGRMLAGAITAVMTGAAYETSTEMAEKLGTFVHYQLNREPMLKVIRQHKSSLGNIVSNNPAVNDLKKTAHDLWNTVVDRGEQFGFRNAQATVIAPTGTISYILGCDTTGIEPAISLNILKRLAGGGELKLVVHEVERALINLGYSPEDIPTIQSFIAQSNGVRGAPTLNKIHYPIFDTALGDGRGNGVIEFGGHVRMLGAAQPFVSGAISKTCNVRESATVKDIYDSYILGHSRGLKALAIFRDNSKASSALFFGDKNFRGLQRGEKEDLPPLRPALEVEVKIGETPFHIIVSEYRDGRPGQITFLSYTSGSTLGALLTTSGIQASKALKRGVALEDVVNGWRGQEFEPHGIVQGYKNIRMALSPLDFAAKFLLLEYTGDTTLATEPEKVNIQELRGARNGVFLTYDRMKVDQWDIEQVLRDHIFGGFVKKNGIVVPSKENNGFKNERGATCRDCGRIMRQYAPSCYTCECGNNIGGCSS